VAGLNASHDKTECERFHRSIGGHARFVTRNEFAKNDFNISPSRYIHTCKTDEHRPLAEIVEALNALEEAAKETDKALRAIFARIGV
jgi:type I restriction enzyme M protein